MASVSIADTELSQKTPHDYPHQQIKRQIP